MTKKHLKILLCASDNNCSSGAFLCLVSLCEELIQKFNLNVLVILPFNGDGTELLIQKKIPYKLIKSENWVIPINSQIFNNSCEYKTWFRNIKAIFKLIYIIKKENIDIVHLNTIWTWVGAVAALATRRPLIWHIRESLELGFSHKIAYFWGYNLINFATKIISISHAVLNSYSNIKKDNAIVVYDGVDDKKYYNYSHEIFNTPRIKIICCGAIYYQKGQIDLINACKLMFDRGYKDWELKIYGRGEEKVIKEYIINNNLENYISLEGYHHNMEDYYVQADIAVVPSHFEGFGRVTVETMMSGCCVIASNSGATPEIIQDKETGILFKVKNAYDLCDKLIWAIENKQECIKIANQGRNYAVQNFNSSKNAQKVNELYESIIKI